MAGACESGGVGTVCDTFLFAGNYHFIGGICIKHNCPESDSQVKEVLPKVADLFASDSGFSAFKTSNQKSDEPAFIYDCFVTAEPKLDTSLSTFPMSNGLWLQCTNRPEWEPSTKAL